MKKLFFSIFVAVAALCSCQQIEVETSLGTIECSIDDTDYTSVQIRYTTNIPEGVSGCVVGVFVTSGEDPMESKDACEFSGGMQAVDSGETEGSVLVEGLKTGTTYKVRACIISTVDGRTVWSEMTSFGTRYPKRPSFIAIETVKVGTTFAVLNAKWEENGLEIKRVGVFYSKYQGKLNIDSDSVENDGELRLYNLEMGTRYYLLPYAVTEEGTQIASEMYIETKTPVAGNAVDLGLSVKWADMNIGAFSPDEYGDYFAWGETAPKAYYSMSNYKFLDSIHLSYNKYVSNSTYGSVDNKSVLDKADDAASALWGGNWRMPTDAEMKELANTANCSWTRTTTSNGVVGYLVQSKKPGYTDRAIFLPFAGVCNEVGNPLMPGSVGQYWTSSLFTVTPSLAYKLNLSDSKVNPTSDIRSWGCSIRPVTK